MKNMLGLAVIVLAVLTCSTAWAQCGCAPVVVSAAYMPEAVPAPAPVYAASYPVAVPTYSAYYPVASVYSAYYAPPVYSAYYARPAYSAYYPAPYAVARPAYMPAAAYYGAPYVVRPKVYVYGQPVRNALRAVTP